MVSQMGYEYITMIEDRHVATITLNRPDKLNALSNEMLSEIRSAFEAIGRDESIRAAIIAGAGRAFCSGFDLESSDQSRGVADWRSAFRFENDVLWTVWHTPVPVVAAVHGYCLGLGNELALVCDVTIAAESAQFGAPEVQFQSAASFLILPWMVGMKKAKELMLTGERIGAREAERCGLANRTVPDADLQSAAWEMAAKFAKMPPPGVRLMKQALNATFEAQGLHGIIDHGIDVATQAQMSESDEARRFFEIADSEGFKAAFKWRDARFEKGGEE